MADISGNPWNFVTADVALTAAITSITRNGSGSALITTTAAHGMVQDQYISVQGTTVAGWRGGYRVLAAPSTTTLLVGIAPQQSLLANNGANGNVLTAAYTQEIEVTQILWDSPTINGVLSLTDLSGRTVWNPTAVSGGTLTYAKVFPIAGLVINALPSGTLQISV
jgi:hypothetical protein